MANNVKQLDSNATAPVELAEGVYALTTQGSICYLVTGTEKGLVIDTGFGADDVLAAAKKATNLPLTLVNTHGHGDHIGRNDQFDETYAHPLEHEKVARKNKVIHPITEGFVFDLGGRQLEVVEIPGHTPGSVALLDRASKMIFTGDMIYDGPLFLQFEYSNLDDYVASMDKLLSMSDVIDTVFCCHGTAVETLEQAKKTRALVLLVKEGKVEGSPVHLETEDGDYDVKQYAHDGAMMFYQ